MAIEDFLTWKHLNKSFTISQHFNFVTTRLDSRSAACIRCSRRPKQFFIHSGKLAGLVEKASIATSVSIRHKAVQGELLSAIQHTSAVLSAKLRTKRMT